jgi:hypothetical protein
VIEGILAQVIFQQNAGAGNAGGLLEQDANVAGVMEDIDEQADVHGIVRKWERVAIEGMASDFATRANQDFYTLHRNVWALLGNKAREGAIAAADVEDRGVAWDLRGQGLRQDADPAVVHQGLVRVPDRAK